MAAATRARKHEFIQRLPERYETELSEGGESLSGGERRRLAIAAVLAWSAFASIDRWARGQAIVRPTGEIVSVRNETTGTIENRPVSHGQEVSTGDLLWEVETDVIEAEQQALRSRRTSLEQNRRTLEEHAARRELAPARIYSPEPVVIQRRPHLRQSPIRERKSPLPAPPHSVRRHLWGPRT